MSDREHTEELIARVAMGDRTAFAALYDRSSAKLFGVVLRVLDSRAEAEDVLQETYVKVWRNAGRYQVNGLSPMTWLITIARNTAIDARRRRVRRASDGDAMLEQMADPGPGPEALALATSETDRLQSCLDELEIDRADAVRRAYLNGDSYAELAAHFDVPLNTMRTWLRRSLIKLRDCLTR